MLPIKQLAVSSQQSAKVSGYTFMETIIVVSLMGIVGLIASSFLITMIGGSSKAEVAKEVRQNGNFALSVMEGLIINSKNVSCPPANKEIDVVDLNGFLAKFICDDAVTYKISSSSPAFATPVDLTGDNVAVSNCNFVCNITLGKLSKVSIDFTVSQRTSSERPNERSSMRFQTEVMTRNY